MTAVEEIAVWRELAERRGRALREIREALETVACDFAPGSYERGLVSLLLKRSRDAEAAK